MGRGRRQTLVPSGRVAVIGIDHSWFSILPGVIDERACGAFLAGQCHAMAFALNERTGWPIVALTDEDDEIIHLMVEAPDRRLVDITGAHHPFGSLDDWNAAGRREVDAASVLALPELGTWRPPDLDAARSFVPPVLEYVSGERAGLEILPEEALQLAESGAPPHVDVLAGDGQMHRLTPGDLDERFREVFGGAQAHALAIAVTIKVSGSGSARPVVLVDQHDRIVRVLAQLGDDLFVDAEGGHREDELLALPRARRIVACRYRDLRERTEDEGWVEPDVGAAQMFAQALLERVGAR